MQLDCQELGKNRAELISLDNLIQDFEHLML